VGPQAIDSETGNLTKGIETATMRITRQIVELLEFPEHSEIDIATEGALQVGEYRDFVAKQQFSQGIGREGGRSHNVIVPISVLVSIGTIT
jgi:hypothetical protein